MSALREPPREFSPAAEREALSSANAARRRERITINALRVLLLVVIIGGWELGAQVGIIDPFFWGRPSGIWAQIVKWVTTGTAQGPLWEQIVVTLEETIIGFVIGVVL